MLVKILSMSLLVLSLPAQAFGAVFTMTNRADGNEVAVALRLPNGALIPFAEFATGGEGTAMDLGSQGALALSGNEQWLLSVNPGSDELTLFRRMLGVVLLQRDVVASGGDMPISVAVNGHLVYVLNAGVPNNVQGFRIHQQELQPIPGATYTLSQADTQPAQVGFDPHGKFLVVTEKATDKIDVFPVQQDGTLGPISVQDSNGDTPFGFEFDKHGTLIVSEAFDGTPDASAVSSYELDASGDLTVITGSAPTHQTAACWIATTPGGSFTYSTNTGSGSISGFSVNPAGTLTELDANGQTGLLGPGGAPIDAAFGPLGHVLFVLDSGHDEVTAFWRDATGSLTALPVAWQLPNGAAGLVVD